MSNLGKFEGFGYKFQIQGAHRQTRHLAVTLNLHSSWSDERISVVPLVNLLFDESKLLAVFSHCCSAGFSKNEEAESNGGAAWLCRACKRGRFMGEAYDAMITYFWGTRKDPQAEHDYDPNGYLPLPEHIKTGMEIFLDAMKVDLFTATMVVEVLMDALKEISQATRFAFAHAEKEFEALDGDEEGDFFDTQDYHLTLAMHRLGQRLETSHE